jgi:hypothetical protein
MKPNDALRLRLDNIPLSCIKGVTTVTISVKPDKGTEPPPVTHQLGKFPSQFTLTNFSPDEPVVTHGGDTHITWTTTYDTDIRYQLHINGVDQTLTPDVLKSHSLWTGALHSNTVYKLTASYQEGGKSATYSAVTEVHVTGSDIRAKKIIANSISLNGYPPIINTGFQKFDLKLRTTEGEYEYYAEIRLNHDTFAIFIFSLKTGARVGPDRTYLNIVDKRLIDTGIGMWARYLVTTNFKPDNDERDHQIIFVPRRTVVGLHIEKSRYFNYYNYGFWKLEVASQ